MDLYDLPVKLSSMFMFMSMSKCCGVQGGHTAAGQMGPSGLLDISFYLGLDHNPP